jgi:alanine-synthesizing transaminase
MFSTIVQRFDVALNALYRERDARKVNGLRTIDLVSGNVNHAGIFFPSDVLTAALRAGAAQAKTYAPHPLGQPAARKAVQAYYRNEGLAVPTDQILITPGTSFSYWYLFRLLADPDEEILCPTPSYPLLDSIAELTGIRLTKYRLRESHRWEIDFEHLHAQLTPKTRAIVLISPHNPTGAVATETEVGQLTTIAREKHLPIICDEVFASFLFKDRPLSRPAAHRAPLVFTLNGLSKMMALPGMKLGWMAVNGESKLVNQAMHALDLMSDTFLPVNETAQYALPLLFRRGKPFMQTFQKVVQKRCTETLRALSRSSNLDFLAPEGGFYLTLRLKDDRDEESIALQLLREGILVHPGYFYDLEGSHLVISFMTQSATGKKALSRIAAL